MNSNKKEYRLFCDQHEDLPVFFQAWWLDIVSDNWDVVLSKYKNGEIRGFWVYSMSNKLGLKVVRQPILTPYTGPFIVYPIVEKKEHSRISFIKRVTEDLIQKLPKFSYFNQHFHPDLSNSQSLFWNGYNQSNLITYRLEKIKIHDFIFKNMESETRRLIKKGEEQFIIEESENLDTFYDQCRDTFMYNDIEIPYSKKLLFALNEKLKDQSRFFFVKNINSEIVASQYLIWDKTCAYNLITNLNRKIENEGAMQFLLWESIKYASERVNSYDFEGSMIKEVEPLFRSFGANQNEYYRVQKFSNRFVEAGFKLLGR